MMRRQDILPRFLLAASLALIFSATAHADTIVLKNGRRIMALKVVEEGDRVKYETSAGELSLPKSIVDHIERGGIASVAEPGGGAGAELTITPPLAELSDPEGAIARGAVHDGVIDREFIAKLDGEARSGSPEANENAAVAHHDAAQFELQCGDIEHALADERTALTYAPDQLQLLLDVAYLYLRQAEYKQSLEYLDRARRVAPKSADVAKLSGWAYYRLNKLDQAVDEWKRALALRADPEVQAALDKALRDKQVEENFRENESSHFILRYSGASQPELAREVLRSLENHFAAIGSELNFTPPESIGVVLYTQQDFADITRAPAWAGALNDGRIRVPVQGLTGVTPDLSRVLKHELTHSFVQQKTHGRAPTWLQEGLAQWMEGLRSEGDAANLVRIYEQKEAASLGALERSWTRLPSEDAAYAYAWSLANVETIVQTNGMTDMERILDRIAAGISTEEALHQVLHEDYDEISQATVEYLKKTYIR
jgi:tetratricopeptide (TPR) repeat protein